MRHARLQPYSDLESMMTATIHRIYTAADHDNLIEVQEMQAQWSANRKAQRDAQIGVYQPLPRFGFAKRLAVVLGLILGLAIGVAAETAWTAHIEAQMEDV